MRSHVPARPDRPVTISSTRNSCDLDRESNPAIHREISAPSKRGRPRRSSSAPTAADNCRRKLIGTGFVIANRWPACKFTDISASRGYVYSVRSLSVQKPREFLNPHLSPKNGHYVHFAACRLFLRQSISVKFSNFRLNKRPSLFSPLSQPIAIFFETTKHVT